MSVAATPVVLVQRAAGIPPWLILLLATFCSLIENRRLVLSILCVAILALADAALSTHAARFFAASLLIGLGSEAVQVLVPYAAHLAPDATRGRVVGNVMSGLMLGIMVARPVASLITEALSCHVVFALSAAVMTALAVVLRLAPPRLQPGSGLRPLRAAPPTGAGPGRRPASPWPWWPGHSYSAGCAWMAPTLGLPCW